VIFLVATKPSANVTAKIPIAMKKSTFATPAAADAIPPNPNAAATNAISKKSRAHLSMFGSRL
jgi:hypothetical protein